MLKELSQKAYFSYADITITEAASKFIVYSIFLIGSRIKFYLFVIVY